MALPLPIGFLRRQNRHQTGVRLNGGALVNFQSMVLSMIVMLASISALAQIDAGSMIGSVADTCGSVGTLTELGTGFNLSAVNNLQKVLEDGLRATSAIQEAI